MKKIIDVLNKSLNIAGIVIDQWGWPSIFYLTGALSLAWVAGWFYLIYDTPDKHPR